MDGMRVMDVESSEPQGQVDSSGGFAKTRRPNRVRSLIRRRGCRGKGRGRRKKKEEQKGSKVAASTSLSMHSSVESVQARMGGKSATVEREVSGAEHGSLPGDPLRQSHNTSIDVVDVEKPKKRVRERRNRKWKPYSEMTWEERLEKDREDERRAEETAKAAEEALGRSSRKKRKRGKDIEVPRAPRNPTQTLLHTDDSFEDGQKTQAAQPLTSMCGMISQNMRQQLATLDDESSDEDDEYLGRIHDRLEQQGKLHFTYAQSPASPTAHSPSSLHDEERGEASDCEEGAGAVPGVAVATQQNNGHDGCNAAVPETDRMMMLELENKRLRERVAELEAAMHKKAISSS